MLQGFLLLFYAVIATAVASGPGTDARSPGPVATPGSLRSELVERSLLRPLPFFYDLYTFRGKAGRTTVIAAFAVTAGRLEKKQDRDVRYLFDVTLVLADTALRSVSRTDDSVVVNVPRALSREHLLYTHVEVQAPPSSSTLQRVIMSDANTPGTGQLYGSPFPIRDYSGSDLMLSDIALGQPGAEAGWRRGDVTLALLPTSHLPESSFDVYYEIYNLPFGNRYSTEVSIEPVDEFGDGRSGSGVSLRFFGESSAGPDDSQNELRRVEAPLPKGHYLLTVTVTDEPTGRTATQSRTFRVRGWGPGATLVPALPRRRGRATSGS